MGNTLFLFTMNYLWYIRFFFFYYFVIFTLSFIFIDFVIIYYLKKYFIYCQKREKCKEK